MKHIRTGSFIEGHPNLSSVRTGWLSREDDHTKRHSGIRVCVDGFLEYRLSGNEGILLFERDSVPPLPNHLWCVGGEWKRGIPSPEEALYSKVLEETGLEIENPLLLGAYSFIFQESPYDSEQFRKSRQERGLGEGIHDLGLPFFAKSKGELNLRSLSNPIIVNRENYASLSQDRKFHPYITECLDKILGSVKD